MCMDEDTGEVGDALQAVCTVLAGQDLNRLPVEDAAEDDPLLMVGEEGRRENTAQHTGRLFISLPC